MHRFNSLLATVVSAGFSAALFWNVFALGSGMALLIQVFVCVALWFVLRLHAQRAAKDRRRASELIMRLRRRERLHEKARVKYRTTQSSDTMRIVH